MSAVVMPAATGTDDSANLNTAITSATAGAYYTGPSGALQGVVQINGPATYRFTNISLPSNIRLEIDASVIVQQVSGATDPAILSADAGGANTPVTNITVIGVGNSSANKESPHQSRVISNFFVANMDSTSSGGTAAAKFLAHGNCSYVMVLNVYFIGNNSNTAGTAPDNTAAHLTYHSNASSILGGPYYHPRHCITANIYGINAPWGFGLTQISSGENLYFYYLYGRGGLPLRMETDFGASEGQAQPARLGGVGGVLGVIATDVIGDSGSAAVDFSPHYQTNYECHVTDILSLSCEYGFKESNFIGGGGTGPAGSFINSTVFGVTSIAGPTAQLSGSPHVVGNSKRPNSLASTGWKLGYTNSKMLEGTNSTNGATLFSQNNTEGVTAGATGYTAMSAPYDPSSPPPPPPPPPPPYQHIRLRNRTGGDLHMDAA